ncbi:MAG: ion transporter [Rubrivivax sp.]
MTPTTLQRRLLQVLERSAPRDRASRWCDLAIATLVLLNVGAIVLDSLPSIHRQWGPAFQTFETFSVAVFSAEFALRLWASGARYRHGPGSAWRGRRRYLFSTYGLIDLMAILPFYLQWLVPGLDLRVLRIVRLVRVFKLSHYSTAIEDLFQAVYQERRSFAAALYLLLIATLMSSTLLYFAEHEAQPERIGSIPDALYWSVITLTTVGYGDLSPVTWAGRVISIATAFLGVCTVALLTGIVASAFANQMARRRVIYEVELRRAMADGNLSAADAETLEKLRQSFNLSAEQAAQMVDQAQRDIGARR